jgi:YVTN family beta-propeller protein
LCLAAVAVLFAGAKLSVRSVATGEPVLPWVAGAPVLGPAPTATPTPGPGRVGLRVRVTDTAGQPLAQALVEVRDRFNTAVGLQETGPNGDAFLPVPPNPSYIVTARKPGYQQGRVEGVEVVRPASDAGTPRPGSTPGPRLAAPAQLVQIQLRPAEGSAPATAGGANPANLTRLYVGHTVPRLSLIDASSNLLLGHSENLGQGRLTLMARSLDGRVLFTAWSGSPDLLVVDAERLTEQRRLALGSGGITSLAVHPGNGRLWVATASAESPDSALLAELDPGATQIIRRTPVGASVANMRFRPDGGVLYLPQRSTSTLSWMDPVSATVVHSIRLTQWASDLAFSAGGRSLFLASLGSERLLELDAASGDLLRSLDVGPGAVSFLPHPDGQRAFVANQLFGYVQILDLVQAQVLDLIPVGRGPQAMALSPDLATLYVANSGSGTISVIDVEKKTVKETINTGGAPSSLLLVRPATA